LFIANGSLCELETQILLSGDLGYFTNDGLEELLKETNEISLMLKAQIKSLQKKHLKS